LRNVTSACGPDARFQEIADLSHHGRRHEQRSLCLAEQFEAGLVVLILDIADSKKNSPEASLETLSVRRRDGSDTNQAEQPCTPAPRTRHRNEVEDVFDLACDLYIANADL
jgi:hypothetical protein